MAYQYGQLVDSVEDLEDEEWLNSDEEESSLIQRTDASEGQKLYRYKLFKTVCVVLVWVCLGMIISVASPTLPDLRDRLHTNMEDLSLALGFRSFGALAGSVICGMLADRYRNKGDLVMGVAVILAGFPEIIKPLTGSLVVVGAAAFIGGIGQGGLEAVGHGIILWMWADKSGPPFHAIHMGYPIGSTLAPLIAMPFLGPDYEDETTTVVPTQMSITLTPAEWNITTATNETEKVSRIEIPYAIVGGITSLVGLAFIALYLVGTPRGFVYHGTEKTSMLEVFSPASCQALGSTKDTCLLLFLICTFYVFVSNKDGVIGGYIFAYAVESELDFTKHEAAIFDTVFRSMEIVGRVIAVLGSHWFLIQPMLFVEVILNTVFTTCLAFVGTRSKTNLWIFACLYKLSAAPVWPSGMTWTSVYLKFASMIVALTQVVLGTTGYFFGWLGGYLYDNFPHSTFIYYGMVCGYVVLVTLVMMQVFASCYSNNRIEDDEEDPIQSFHDKCHINSSTERTQL